jgi:molybdopterin/thiamine biosynthesis adenylyltransferase/rhodanese-related sulfurtransferase
MVSSRYDRQICLPELGHEGQRRLSQASVVIVGAGGMGCPVLQYLAAAGVGRLGIVDSDIVEESNLQRQVIYGVQSLGKNKSVEAGDYIKNLNPEVKTELYPYRLTEENASTILSQYDWIIDCSDNFGTRYLLDDCCKTIKKPWIYGAIHRYEGQVSVFNYQGGPSYRELFPYKSTEVIPDCASTGVLGVLPGMTGMLQAAECIKLITGIGDVLSGQLLVFNLLAQEFSRFSFYDLQQNTISPKTLFISAKQLRENQDNYIVVDVRELHEEPPICHSSVYRIPLSELSLRVGEIPTTREVALICQTGYRSQLAAEILAKTDRFNRIYSVQGGVTEYESIC